MNLPNYFRAQWTSLLLAVLLVLFSRDGLQGQLESRGVGSIQTFSEPDPQSDHLAINEHKKVLRAEVAIGPNTTVRFYEQPTSMAVYNSTVSVERDGLEIATYPVAKMIRHQTLRLVHTALLQSGDTGMLIGEYEGGAVGAREGFAILRFSPLGVKLHTLPLTDYGKVVVFRSNPDQVEVWSADPDEDVGSPVADRPYVARACRWQAQGYLCGPPKRKPGVFTPGGISDPGIEIR
jgi:hypothetical protein